MNSITSFQNIFHNNLNKINQNFFLDFKVNDYKGFMDSLAKNVACSIGRTISQAAYETDELFKHSSFRKNMYYTKGKRVRTIMTIYGSVKLEREYYVDKKNNSEGFFFVDELLGLPKNDYYDPQIKSQLMEELAQSNSSSAARNIERAIRLSSGSDNIRLSRQLVHSIFTKSHFPSLDELDNNESKYSSDVLYLMLDEKYVHSQGNNRRNHMIKHAVLFTDIRPVKGHANRRELVNKSTVSAINSTEGMTNLIQEVIYNNYIVDDIKHFYILGDGANWIKCIANDLYVPNATKTSITDLFHVFQATNKLTTDKTLRASLREKILRNELKDIKRLYRLLCNTSEETESMINNFKYLTRNWSTIQNNFRAPSPGCSMESHISHDCAKIYARDPKGYKQDNLKRLITLRNLLLNGYVISDLYFHYKNPAQSISDIQEYTWPIKTTNVPLVESGNVKTARLFKSICHRS